MTGASQLAPDEVAVIAAAECTDCGWYHGFWPLIRALGFGTVPEDHAGFYQSALAEAVQAGPVERVLVCAAADQSMPVLAYTILRELGREPEITVLDRCRTPLAMCERAFAGSGARLQTISAPALSADPGEGFDLIVTHSFLGYFDDEERQGLLTRWTGWLRPGGRVVTVNRLREAGPAMIGFSEPQANAFVERILHAVAAQPGLTTLTVDEIAARAREYTRRFHINPLISTARLADQCRAAGLTPSIVDLGQVSRSGPTGPTAPGSATYLGITLTK